MAAIPQTQQTPAANAAVPAANPAANAAAPAANPAANAAAPAANPAANAAAPVANPAANAAAPVQAQPEAVKVRTFAQTIFLPFTLTVELVVRAIKGVVTVIKAIVGVPFKIASYVSGNSATQQKLTEEMQKLSERFDKLDVSITANQTETCNLRSGLNTLEVDNHSLKDTLVTTAVTVTATVVATATAFATYSYFGG